MSKKKQVIKKPVETIKADVLKEPVKKAKQEPIYSAEQLSNTLDFVLYRDIISIVAENDKGYTKSQMQKLIDDFLNMEVD